MTTKTYTIDSILWDYCQVQAEDLRGAIDAWLKKLGPGRLKTHADGREITLSELEIDARVWSKRVYSYAEDVKTEGGWILRVSPYGSSNGGLLVTDGPMGVVPLLGTDY